MEIRVQYSGYYYQKLQKIEGDPTNPSTDNTLTVEMKEDQITPWFFATIKLKESSKGEQMLDLHSPQAKEFVDELMLDAFITYDDKDPEGKGTGHVLAATYIQSKLPDSNGIFYTAIGNSVNTRTEQDNTFNFRRNIMADLIKS